MELLGYYYKTDSDYWENSKKWWSFRIIWLRNFDQITHTKGQPNNQ